MDWLSSVTNSFGIICKQRHILELNQRVGFVKGYFVGLFFSNHKCTILCVFPALMVLNYREKLWFVGGEEGDPKEWMLRFDTASMKKMQLSCVKQSILALAVAQQTQKGTFKIKNCLSSLAGVNTSCIQCKSYRTLRALAPVNLWRKGKPLPISLLKNLQISTRSS